MLFISQSLFFWDNLIGVTCWSWFETEWEVFSTRVPNSPDPFLFGRLYNLVTILQLVTTLHCILHMSDKSLRLTKITKHYLRSSWRLCWLAKHVTHSLFHLTWLSAPMHTVSVGLRTAIESFFIIDKLYSSGQKFLSWGQKCLWEKLQRGQRTHDEAWKNSIARPNGFESRNRPDYSMNDFRSLSQSTLKSQDLLRDKLITAVHRVLSYASKASYLRITLTNQKLEETTQNVSQV